MYKVIICDDDKDICNWLAEKLNAHYANKLCISVCEYAEELLEEGKEQEVQADIILMDILLKDANGIKIIQQIQESKPELKAIFITGYIDYASDIFCANPSSFLVKPLKEENLYEAVDKVIGEMMEEESQSYVLKSKGNIARVKFSDILYCESEKRVLILHEKKRDVISYKKLDEVEQELPDYFLRCHQSYLVNMNQIMNFEADRIMLYGGQEVPVSRAKRKEARERFLEFIGKFE